MNAEIVIKGAHRHNLKHIDLSIPKYKLVVLTGLSGSGKSTLAIETLHKEGQRQYLEALGFVSFATGKPEVESISGLSPSVSVDQHLVNRSPRSTVGTATDVFTYLRVLFARIGRRLCPNCGVGISPVYEVGSESDEALENDVTYPCARCGAPVPNLTMAHFSFNKPQGACPICSGLGVLHGGNLDLLIDPTRSIQEGGVLHWDIHEVGRYTRCLIAAGRHYKFDLDPAVPIGEWGAAAMSLLLYGALDDRFRRHFPLLQPPETVSGGRFEGIVPILLRRYSESVNNPAHRAKLSRMLMEQTCPDCNGTRLRPDSRTVTVEGRTIIELSRLPLTDLMTWIDSLEKRLSGQAWLISEPVVADLHKRVLCLIEVGLGYLNIDRATPSLSGGEAQRLQLAALLGSGLTGILYVLDEPTIGMHPRDTARLIRALRQLRDLGNTVLVIEHDLDMMRAADLLIDMGPGAGPYGGQIMAAGTPGEVAEVAASLTGQYLSGRKAIPVPAGRRQENGHILTVRGARAHNLKNLTVDFPLGRLIAVVGVSGSGKSSIVLDILGRAAGRRYHRANEIPGEHDTITGWEYLNNVVAIDQTPIGRSPRSNAATYTDVYTAIRRTFASQPGASGLDARHFSFNLPGGRCERCEGAGVLMVNMHFLPDVEVRCPVCRGRRFKQDVLQVKYRGFDVAQALDMSIEEALVLFGAVPAVAGKLRLMNDVGLGYLKLGQPATTLSGGEAQRIKLANELGRRSAGHTLYLLDEPTSGLHPEDITRLLAVLQRLVDAGNTVLVIEHNIGLIRAADWLIELGPEGGASGGYLIAEGTPEEIVANPASPTAPFLALVSHSLPEQPIDPIVN